MDEPNKLKSMLVQYASSHQNKINVLLHFVGIPTIILGICIPLSWLKFNVVDISFTPAHIILLSLLFEPGFASIVLPRSAAAPAELPMNTRLENFLELFFFGFFLITLPQL